MAGISQPAIYSVNLLGGGGVAVRLCGHELVMKQRLQGEILWQVCSGPLPCHHINK
jgi:hypothetical protein